MVWARSNTSSFSYMHACMHACIYLLFYLMEHFHAILQREKIQQNKKNKIFLDTHVFSCVNEDLGFQFYSEIKWFAPFFGY